MIGAGDEAVVAVSGRRDTPDEVDDSLHPHLLRNVEGAEEETGFLDAIQTMDQEFLVMRL